MAGNGVWIELIAVGGSGCTKVIPAGIAVVAVGGQPAVMRRSASKP